LSFFHLRYGFYGKTKNPHSTPYFKVLDECKGWKYSERVAEAMEKERNTCRQDVVLFDHSSFGKVNCLFLQK